jgi:dTMP kinase
MEHEGFFIVLEGSDGCGKSTQARLLCDRLREQGGSCVLTEEPGATPTGKAIRELILHPRSHMDAKTELFLFLADRADHVSTCIRPALARGSIVISSRYLFSTLVYQGLVRSAAPQELLLQMNLFAVDSVLPDMVIYLDVDPVDGLSMAKNATRHALRYPDGDRIEAEGLDFQRKVRTGYCAIAARFPGMFETVQVTGKTREQVAKDVYDLVSRRLHHDRNGTNRRQQR